MRESWETWYAKQMLISDGSKLIEQTVITYEGLENRVNMLFFSCCNTQEMDVHFHINLFVTFFSKCCKKHCVTVYPEPKEACRVKLKEYDN